ncbi:MAG: rhomboid family intramembrane serine protease [Candidatus Nanohaloarchaea archaeon]
MPECSECGETVSMPFRCKFCEESFCSKHRLPENHECEGLRDYKDEQRGEGKIGYEVMKDEKEERTETVGREREEERAWKDRLDKFLPQSVTFTVLGVMAAVFVLEYTVPGFFQMFALAPGEVLQQPWTLFTSIFMHAGLAHLLINAIVLWSFGRHLENVLGSRRFLEVLLVSALASSVGFAISGQLFGIGPAVGISGGLYGLVTLLAVIRPEVKVLAFFVIPLEIRHAVAFFAIMDTVNVVAHSMEVMLPVIGGFASAGHLSGLLVGLIYGYRWKDRFRRRSRMSVWDMVQ